MRLTIGSAERLEDVTWSETSPKFSPFPDFSTTSARIASGGFGKFLFHRLKGKGYTIAHLDYSAVKNSDVILESPFPFLGLQLQYKNNIVFTLKGLGEINLRESQFHFSYVPDIYFSTSLEKDLKYSTFNIHFSTYFLHDFLHLFPELRDFLSNAKERKAYMLRNSLFYSSTDMRMIVGNIVKSKFSGEVRKIFIDLKVMELLVLVIEHFNQDTGIEGIPLSENDKENIYKAAELIAENIKEPLTIRTLSVKCAINANKLQKGFKKLFSKTVFEYLTELRMERAQELLRSSDISVTDIAYVVGYKNVSNFSTAYKKHYAYSPAYLRR